MIELTSVTRLGLCKLSGFLSMNQCVCWGGYVVCLCVPQYLTLPDLFLINTMCMWIGDLAVTSVSLTQRQESVSVRWLPCVCPLTQTHILSCSFRSWLMRCWVPQSQSPGSGPGSSARTLRARMKFRKWTCLTARRTPSSWRCWSLAWFGEFLQASLSDLTLPCCLQIDDTDAVEDIHALLTDAPTPTGRFYLTLHF